MGLTLPGKIFKLPKIEDERGNLSFIEEISHIPFTIARTFWIYDVPGGEVRGGHAYKDAQEFIVAISGSFDIVLFDGKTESKFSLNRSYYGLYIPSMIWRHMENFSTNSLALVLSDQPYREEQYIRDRDEFTSLKNA